jgi:hypothetical protein
VATVHPQKAAGPCRGRNNIAVPSAAPSALDHNGCGVLTSGIQFELNPCDSPGRIGSVM